MKVSVEREGYSISFIGPEIDEWHFTVPEIVERLVRPAMRALGYGEPTLEKVLGEVNEAAI